MFYVQSFQQYDVRIIMGSFYYREAGKLFCEVSLKFECGIS